MLAVLVVATFLRREALMPVRVAFYSITIWNMPYRLGDAIAISR